jgi:hypothetical protein
MAQASNPFFSTVVPHDDQGWQVPFTQNPNFQAPVFVNVESARRDVSRYPNAASFELHFPHVFKGVSSIEVMDIILPSTPAGSEPPGNYFFMANGLVDATTGAFNNEGIVGVYTDMGPERTITSTNLDTIENRVDPGAAGRSYVTSSISRAAAAPYVESVGSRSFGKFFYIQSSPVQAWERRNLRKVHYFTPELGKLGSLQFSLLNRDASLYTVPDAPNADWSCTLMITCRE